MFSHDLEVSVTHIWYKITALNHIWIYFFMTNIYSIRRHIWYSYEQQNEFHIFFDFKYIRILDKLAFVSNFYNLFLEKSIWKMIRDFQRIRILLMWQWTGFTECHPPPLWEVYIKCHFFKFCCHLFFPLTFKLVKMDVCHLFLITSIASQPWN